MNPWFFYWHHSVLGPSCPLNPDVAFFFCVELRFSFLFLVYLHKVFFTIIKLCMKTGSLADSSFTLALCQDMEY